MIPKTRVAVYGSCLYMACLAGGLQANPILDVVHIGASSPSFPQGLADLAPAVVVFDPRETPGDLATSVLQDRPGLRLISVDQATDEMLIASGQRATVRSANDFLKLIDLREDGSAG